MSEKKYVIKLYKKKKTWIELIPKEHEKWKKNLVGSIWNTKFITKTFVVTGQTQRQNEP